ncbi:MAG TPA: hypothetical protein VKY85_13495 [Candidatus Angelobacter sp.]|nr:hypothetical protein [Candidatus Angelobacter sp.]
MIAQPEFRIAAICAAGFADIETDVIQPVDLMNRTISERRIRTQ